MTYASNRSAAHTVVQAIAPDGDRTTTQTSPAVDLSDCVWAQVHVNYGTITDGTFTPSVTDSVTSDGTFEANTAAVVGTPAAGSSAADDRVATFDIDPAKAKRYVKVVLTASGSPVTGGKFAVTVVKANRVLG
jgi:hypothetical protein